MKIAGKILFITATFYHYALWGMYLHPDQEAAGRTMIKRYAPKIVVDDLASELVSQINDPEPGADISDLEQKVIDIIKQKELSDFGSLRTLRSHEITKNIMSILIKDENIDVKLLNPYNIFLRSHPKVTSEYTLGDKKLLFFSDHTKIYGIVSSENEIDGYEQLIIEQVERSSKKIKLFFKIFKNRYLQMQVSKNGNYCIIFTPSKTELWNIKDTPKLVSLDQNITAYCFADNNEICTADIYGRIKLLDLEENEEEQIVRFKLPLISSETKQDLKSKISERIERLEYCVTSDHQKIIVALTNKNKIHIFQNGKIIIKTEDLWNQSGEPKSPKAYDIKLSHSGTYLCILTDSQDTKKKTSPMFLFNISQSSCVKIPVTEHIAAKYVTDMAYYHRDQGLYWAKNDSLLTLYCNHFAPHNPYVAINPITLHYWSLIYQALDSKKFSKKNVPLYPDAVANDGNSFIVQKRGLASTTTERYTICDDIMEGALDYLNPTKEHKKKDVIQRFFGTILLYKILQKQKPVILNEAEQLIYNNDLSEEIRTILNKTGVVVEVQKAVQTTQPVKQSIFASMYNSLSKKLSEYRVGLIATGASAIAIAAVYKFLSSKQQ